METSEPKPDAEKCPKCGGWINETSSGEGVCSHCDAKFESKDGREQKSPPGVLICPKCGSREEAAADALYCDQCGGSLAGVSPITDAPPTVLDDRPSDGVCPACRGPVVEVSVDRGVCKKCGLKLMTPEARARRLWGLAIVVLAAAAYVAYLTLSGPGRRPF